MFKVGTKTMKVMALIIEDFFYIQFLVENVWNGVVVLYHFNFFNEFDLLMTKEVENRVKALNTISYLNFL